VIFVWRSEISEKVYIALHTAYCITYYVNLAL